MGKNDKGKLKLFQVIAPKVTIAKLSALASMQGMPKTRLGGELLAQGVDFLWDETFGLQGLPATERASAFDSSPGIHAKKKKGGKK